MLHQFQTKDFSVYNKLINNIRKWNLISKKTKTKKNNRKKKHALVMSTTANNLGLTKHSAHFLHYNDVIMSSMASEITGVAIVCSTVGSGADQRKHHQWRHNGRVGVSNHHPQLFIKRTSKKTSQLYVTSLCAGNSPVTDEFPAQKASNTENVCIWWRHHDGP